MCGPIALVGNNFHVMSVAQVEAPRHRGKTDSVSCLEGDVSRFLDDVAADLVRCYFDPEGGFSGSAFETLAGGGDAPGNRNVFAAEDLVAVTLLDMTVPGNAALDLLDRRASDFSGLLTSIPVGVDLWNATDEQVGLESPAAILWERLMSYPGMGWVTTSKLLARKRPRLLPVYDTVVQAALQPSTTSFWLPLREELQDTSLVARLEEVRNESGLGEEISLLRILDVAVWMRNREASTCKLPFSSCPRWTTD